MADFGRAQPSMTLHSIQFTCVKRVECTDILPLIDCGENVDPCSREHHRGEDGWCGRHAVSSVGEEANLIAVIAVTVVLC